MHASVEAVIGKVVDQMKEVLLNKNIRLEVLHLNTKYPSCSFEVKHQLYFIIKEAVHNASIHSGCTRIQITTDLLNKNTMRIRISDDGLGIDMDQPTVRMGLSNMKSRASHINGSLNIGNNTTGGAYVELVIKK